MTRLVLMRHGRTEWNLAGRLQGVADVELDELGEAQALAAAPHVAALAPDVVFSSDLTRAVRTAQAVAGVLGQQVVTDPRLREIDVGDWAGLTWAEVDARDPELAQAARASEPVRYGATGESREQVALRIATALEDLAARFEGGTVLAVSHGLALRVGASRVLGWDVREADRIASMGNCAWSVLDQQPGRPWRLQAWNCTAPVV